jgi:opacity protein-like surface antigen
MANNGAAIFLLFTASVAFAQARPKVEVFGGYSLLHGGSDNLSGWDAAATANITRWLGITGNFDGHYFRRSAQNVQIHDDIYSFMFGPNVSYRKTRFTLFTHSLFGVSHEITKFEFQSTGVTVSSSSNQFQLALGGGVDIKLTSRLAFRFLQADYLLTKYPDRNVNQFRYSTGLVLRL